MPKTESERKQLALQIGRDGYELLSWLDVSQTPPDLSGEPAVAVLWRVWLQQYYRQENNVFWRELDNLPPSEQLIQSPFLSTGSTKSPWLLLASQPLLLWPPPQAVPEFANSIV